MTQDLLLTGTAEVGFYHNHGLGYTCAEPRISTAESLASSSIFIVSSIPVSSHHHVGHAQFEAVQKDAVLAGR